MLTLGNFGVPSLLLISTNNVHYLTIRSIQLGCLAENNNNGM